jgi:hypothetical protein
MEDGSAHLDLLSSLGESAFFSILPDDPLLRTANGLARLRNRR